MNKQKPDPDNIIDSVKYMSLEELHGYMRATKMVSRTVNVLGVFFMLIIMYYPLFQVILPSAIIIYLLGHFSVSTLQLQALLTEHISIRSKTDK